MGGARERTDGLEGAGLLPGGRVHPGVESAIGRSRGGGRALAAPDRARMAHVVGDPLTDVRVHTDDLADALAHSVSARAITTGADVFFARDQFRPGTSTGDALLAHELAHVVQQRSAPTNGTLRVTEPGDAIEAGADAIVGGDRAGGDPAVTPVLAREKTKLRPITWVPRIRRREEGPPELHGADGGVQARLTLLGNKLDSALAEIDDIDDADTLTLFMAPEWYFTGHGVDIPYTRKQFLEVVDGLGQISQRHPQVLLIPGTVRWWQPHEPAKPTTSVTANKKKTGNGPDPPFDPRFPVRKPEQALVQLWNSAVVFYGGQLRHVYHKQHEGGDKSSDLGWVGTNYEVMPDEVEELFDIVAWRKGTAIKQQPTIEQVEQRTSSLRRVGAASNLFTVEGVHLAVDICRDFGAGTALREYIDRNPTGEGVDAHLVIYGGGGAALGPDLTAARTGGYTVVADAFGTSADARGKTAQVSARKGTVQQDALSGERVTYDEKNATNTRIADVLIFDSLPLPGRAND
jgi:hypothetical protein